MNIFRHVTRSAMQEKVVVLTSGQQVIASGRGGWESQQNTPLRPGPNLSACFLLSSAVDRATLAEASLVLGFSSLSQA